MQTAIAISTASARQAPNPSPTFIIGQDRKGSWIARDTRGMRGGIFTSKGAAMDYAAFETGNRPGAVRFTAEPMELAV